MKQLINSIFYNTTRLILLVALSTIMIGCSFVSTHKRLKKIACTEYDTVSINFWTKSSKYPYPLTFMDSISLSKREVTDCRMQFCSLYSSLRDKVDSNYFSDYFIDNGERSGYTGFGFGMSFRNTCDTNEYFTWIHGGYCSIRFEMRKKYYYGIPLGKSIQYSHKLFYVNEILDFEVKLFINSLIDYKNKKLGYARYQKIP
ncbi:MAG: hypothetical protein K1X91_08870 [Bacteriodetes bacterium]|nr:hypothetical protein [Bacteroidota bacterium]